MEHPGLHAVRGAPAHTAFSRSHSADAVLTLSTPREPACPAGIAPLLQSPPGGRLTLAPVSGSSFPGGSPHVRVCHELAQRGESR